MKKNVLLLALTVTLLILQCHSSFAARYYFSSSGDDSRTAGQAQNPDTPWKSIDKLNTIFKTLKPGDEVLFKRGEVFYGTLKITRSGAQGRPIKIGAYGVGDKPVITSLVTITNWKNVGNGVYEGGHPLLKDDVAIVLLNEEVQEMGRFPNRDASNGGYLTISSHVGNSSVTSSGLSASTNFTGGEVVIRKNQWVIDRHKIMNHSGNRVSYMGLGAIAPSNDYGFFIQGHRNTLDRRGEWYFNPSNKKIYVHFGSGSPSSTKIEVATKDNLLIKGYLNSYITIENLILKGANKDVIHIAGGRGISIENTDVEYAGENGITSMSILDLVINNNRVNYSNNNGIYLRYGNKGAKVTNNVVENTFVFPGASQNGDGNGIGIYALDDNTLIEYNQVKYTGYSGIHFGGNSTVVKNNLVDVYCMLKNDGGGVYSYGGPNNVAFRNRKVTGNIILNGVGSTDGIPEKTFTAKGQAEGIFLDDNSNGIELIGNTIAYAANSGIKLANTRNVKVSENTIYNSNSQILIGNRGRAADTRNLSISENVLFSKYSDQWSYIIRTKQNDVGKFGDFSKNILYRPLGDGYNILVSLMEGSKEDNKIYNLERWQQSYNKDRGSSAHPEPIKRFEVKRLLGENVFKNEGFNSGISGLICNSCEATWDNGKMSGGSAKIESASYSSSTIAIGSVKQSKNYVLNFKAASNRKGAIRVYMRHAGSPWQEVSPSTTVEVGPDKKDYSVLLQPYGDIENTIVMFSSDEKNWTYWLDDVEFREAEVELIKPEEKFLFEYNASKSSKSIPLAGTYVDVTGKEFTGSVSLPAYSSIILIQTSTAGTPTPEYKLQASIITPKADQQITAGDELIIAAGVSATDDEIKQVEFFNGSKHLATVTKAPYTYTWDKVPAGEHSLTIVATGSKNRTATSEPVRLRVKELPKDDVGGGRPGEGSQDAPEVFSPLYYNIGSKEILTYGGNKFEPIPESNVVSDSFRKSLHRQASKFKLFQSSEYGAQLKYAIPVPNGTYTVQTYHHEVYYGNAGPRAAGGQRVFDILVEGEVKEEGLDMYTKNGNNETILTFENITVTDGVLNIELVSSVENAIISAIAVLPDTQSVESPVVKAPVVNVPENAILINVGGLSDVEYEGNTFISDYKTRYFAGSSNINSNGDYDGALFQTYRFSRDFSYNIPVPNGVYSVITYHHEPYFGKTVQETGANKRVFDIYVEDQVVKSNADLFVENDNEPVAFHFERVRVNDGMINLRLLASVNSAILSGIAIINESEVLPIEGASLRVEVAQSDPVEEPAVAVDETTSEVKLYPNPATDVVNLAINKDFGRFSVLIHNANGQLVAHHDPENLGLAREGFAIPIGHLTSGVYLVTLAGDREIIKRLRLIVGP